MECPQCYSTNLVHRGMDEKNYYCMDCSMAFSDGLYKSNFEKMYDQIYRPDYRPDDIVNKISGITPDPYWNKKKYDDIYRNGEVCNKCKSMNVITLNKTEGKCRCTQCGNLWNTDKVRLINAINIIKTPSIGYICPHCQNGPITSTPRNTNFKCTNCFYSWAAYHTIHITPHNDILS